MLGRWHKKGGNGPWQGRDGAGLVELNGDLYLLGGWNTYNPAPSTNNEVWMLPKGRETWQRLANAPWAPRHGQPCLVHDGKLWVIGGDINSGYYQKDVWCGEPYRGRIKWTEVSANAPWANPGRTLHIGFSFDGKIVVLGGQTLDEFAGASHKANRVEGPYYSDVWSWSDGAGWVKESDGNAWAPRGVIMGGPVKDGKMWLIGGGAYDTAGLPRVYRNDVWWSDNIADWHQATPNGGFPARQFNNTAVLGGELVLFAGWSGANMNDLHTSKDGVIWQERKFATPITPRHAASMCRKGNELIMLGGPLGESSVFGLS